jgi:hypothetical protein
MICPSIYNSNGPLGTNTVPAGTPVLPGPGSSNDPLDELLDEDKDARLLRLDERLDKLEDLDELNDDLTEENNDESEDAEFLSEELDELRILENFFELDRFTRLDEAELIITTTGADEFDKDATDN